MIKLFRNTRKKLVSEKPSVTHTTNYIKYAFGEIVLVVIGILIALQINNWNENRIRAIEELNILKALKVGLEKDYTDLIYNTKKIESSMASADKVIYALEHNMPYKDSIADYMGGLMLPVMFVHSTSAFETLKSKGIDIIKNALLRDKIIDVYDSGYNFFLKNESIVLDENERGLKEIFPKRFEASYVYDLKKPNYQPRLVPLNFEALKTDQEFKYYLKSYKNRLNILLNFQYKARLLKSLKSLIISINNEINSLEK